MNTQNLTMKGTQTQENPYIPKQVRITEIVTENDVNHLKTFKLEFLNEQDAQSFRYLPGQFAELTVFGVGESPIGIASSPTEKGYILFTVKRTGRTTEELHALKKNAIIGIRGPFGNGWPLQIAAYKNIIIIGGGFAFSTLRSLTKFILEPLNRNNYKDLTVIYGARSPGELCYKPDLAQWGEMKNINLILTVDKRDDRWTKREGFVPAITKQVAPSPNDALVFVCGPPVMIRFTLPVLTELGFTDEQIYFSLERRMKCGIGKCGRCTIGQYFVCIDGPVFSQAQLKTIPESP